MDMLFDKLTAMSLLSLLTTAVMVWICFLITLQLYIVEPVNNFCDGTDMLFDKLTAMSMLSLLTTDVMVQTCYLINLQLCHC